MQNDLLVEVVYSFTFLDRFIEKLVNRFIVLGSSETDYWISVFFFFPFSLLSLLCAELGIGLILWVKTWNYGM